MGKTGKKSRKAGSRQVRIRELILEVDGLDRLISSEADPTENDRALMKQRQAVQHELCQAVKPT